jgi:hypothetical protein
MGRRAKLATLSLLLTVLFVPALPAPAQLTTLAYRETSESFTWELDWDGTGSPTEVEYSPVRPDPTLPELWTPVLRLSVGAKTFRCTVRARHNCRVHELDAPKGSALQLLYPIRERLKGPSEWARVEARAVPHLHTGRDHRDEYELLARTETDAQGRKVYRLVLQGVHGLAAKPKKLKAGKKR